MSKHARWVAAAIILTLAGCGGGTSHTLPHDAGVDATGPDAGPGDAGPPDAGPSDAGPRDAGPRDAGPVDAGPVDAGPVDAGPVDAGPVDAGPVDAAPMDAGPMDAGPPDAGPLDAGPPCTGGATYDYVITYLDAAYADPAGDPSIVAGFDLDSEVGDGTQMDSCFQVDYTAPDGTPGIDNQLGPILGSLGTTLGLSSSIESSIDSGSLLVIAELSGVDDLTDDDCVTVSLLRGRVPVGSTVALGADGRLAPGQTFDIDAASFMADGVTPVTSFNGRIVGGHLTAGSAPWPFDLPLSGGTLHLEMYDTHVAADVTATTWTNGVIGGWLDDEALIAAVGAYMPGLEATARSVVEGDADLAYDPATGTCGHISLAMVFDTVTAMRGVTR